MITKEHLITHCAYFNYQQDAEINLSPETYLILSEPAFQYALVNGKVFVIDEDLITLLSPNLTRNKIHLRSMPFDQIIMLNTFKIRNSIFRGMILSKIFSSNTNQEDLCCWTLKQRDESDAQLYKFTLLQEDIMEQNRSSREEDLRWTKEDDLITRDMKVFVCNFIDSLNDKENEIKIEGGSERQNKKRLARRQTPIPKCFAVHISRDLKLYLNRIKSQTKGKYSHRFWIRGHFRTLRSEIYKERSGEKVWIKPHLKGQGIIVNKRYEFE